jgi:predicted nucleic acid-binding protein
VVLVDTSVWIEYLLDRTTPQTAWLESHLEVDRIAVADIILTEVLQGFRYEKAFQEARRLLGNFEQITLSGVDLAVKAAQNYRQLRSLGITARGTVDVLIATRCIEDGLQLLHCDRDFDPFERHLGLQVVDCTSWLT